MTRTYESLFTFEVTLLDGKIEKTYTVTGTGEQCRHMEVYLEDAKRRGALKDYAWRYQDEVIAPGPEDKTTEEIENLVRLGELIANSYPYYAWCTEAEFECHRCGKTFKGYAGDYEYETPWCGCKEEEQN